MNKSTPSVNQEKKSVNHEELHISKTSNVRRRSSWRLSTAGTSAASYLMTKVKRTSEIHTLKHDDKKERETSKRTKKRSVQLLAFRLEAINPCRLDLVLILNRLAHVLQLAMHQEVIVGLLNGDTTHDGNRTPGAVKLASLRQPSVMTDRQTIQIVCASV